MLEFALGAVACFVILKVLPSVSYSREREVAKFRESLNKVCPFDRFNNHVRNQDWNKPINPLDSYR